MQVCNYKNKSYNYIFINSTRLLYLLSQKMNFWISLQWFLYIHAWFWIWRSCLLLPLSGGQICLKYLYFCKCCYHDMTYTCNNIYQWMSDLFGVKITLLNESTFAYQHKSFKFKNINDRIINDAPLLYPLSKKYKELYIIISSLYSLCIFLCFWI